MITQIPCRKTVQNSNIYPGVRLHTGKVSCVENGTELSRKHFPNASSNVTSRKRFPADSSSLKI